MKQQGLKICETKTGRPERRQENPQLQSGTSTLYLPSLLPLPLAPTTNINTRQTISKNIKELNNTINSQDLIYIYITLHPSHQNVRFS